VESLNLLQNLLQRETKYRNYEFSEILEHNFFKQNDQITTKEELRAKHPEYFTEDGLYILTKVMVLGKK